MVTMRSRLPRTFLVYACHLSVLMNATRFHSQEDVVWTRSHMVTMFTGKVVNRGHLRRRRNWRTRWYIPERLWRMTWDPETTAQCVAFGAQGDLE